jgi:hypothetical protein
MGNFSKDPLQVLADNLAQGYIGLHLQQGVPLLDRDINLLQDFLLLMIRQFVGNFFGDGVLTANSFRIDSSPQNHNFLIQPGSALASGMGVTVAASFNYTDQTGVPPLTVPSAAQPDPRTDIVYLDVSVRERTAADDNMLANEDDIGVETSVRLQPISVVRVAENTTVPAPAVGHAHLRLATLRRPRGNAVILPAHILDARRILVTLPNVDDRLRALERQFAPRIVSINPPFQTVGNNVTISGENLNTSGAGITFIPTNTAIAPIQAPLVSASNAQIVTTVPNFPGTPGGIPCRIRIQTIMGAAESDPATQPFTVNDAVP